jgi:hypothetical protein
VRVAYSAWYVTADNIRLAASSALDANLDPGYAPIADTMRITLIGPPTVQGDNVTYQLDAARQVKATWSKDNVIHLVRGKDLITAAVVVQEKLLLKSPPQFSMSPHWWPRLPYLPFRIQVGGR